LVVVEAGAARFKTYYTLKIKIGIMMKWMIGAIARTIKYNWSKAKD